MKIVVEFKPDSGETVTATFDRDTGAVSASDGRAGTYARPDGSRTLTIKADQEFTLTFEEDIRFEPGFSTRYSGPTGAGVATIKSVT